MSVRRLPERPNLDQLKHQAKELLAAWRRGASSDVPDTPRLRDAQRAIAQQYGFDSWDTLRAHVESITGPFRRTQRHSKKCSTTTIPSPTSSQLDEPLTTDVVQRLVEDGVSGIKVGPKVSAESLARLAAITSLRRIDLAWRGDLLDGDLTFLEAMPWLTALSLSRCGQITDRTIELLRAHQHLQRINLQWTDTGDAAIAALAGKQSLSRVACWRTAHRRRRSAVATTSLLWPRPEHTTRFSRSAPLAHSQTRRSRPSDRSKGVVALDLHMSAFGSPHYTARGVEHLRRMASLEELNFHGALATDDVLVEIAAIPRLRWLHCQDPVSGDEGFIALGACTTPREHCVARVPPDDRPRLCRDRAAAAPASLGLGGPRISDAAMAHLADAPALVDLGPIMFGDAAFEHIAKIPRLERLTNMYNRSTGDGATRYLRAHPTLVHYGAFGTQITDESLRILAGLPRLETGAFTNCDFITDDGHARARDAAAASPGVGRVVRARDRCLAHINAARRRCQARRQQCELRRGISCRDAHRLSRSAGPVRRRDTTSARRLTTRECCRGCCASACAQHMWTRG